MGLLINIVFEGLFVENTILDKLSEIYVEHCIVSVRQIYSESVINGVHGKNIEWFLENLGENNFLGVILQIQEIIKSFILLNLVLYKHK